MLADFCKHRFLLSLSPVIPTQCGGVHKMKATNFKMIQVSQVGSTRPEMFVASRPERAYCDNWANHKRFLRAHYYNHKNIVRDKRKSDTCKKQVPLAQLRNWSKMLQKYFWSIFSNKNIIRSYHT